MKKTMIMTIQKRIAVMMIALLVAVGLATSFVDLVPSAYAQPVTTAGAPATTGTPEATTATNGSTPSIIELNANNQEAIKMAAKLNIPLPVAEALQTFIVFITIILKVLYALLVPVAGMIGKFMSNDWVTGTVFRLDIVIETIWQFIRNLVNIVIIMYLLYVAARNIVPFGDNGQYDIKQVLPKVALALVIVNFSLFFCRTVLTLSNIATTMAFSLPAQIGKSDVLAGFNAVPDFVEATGKLKTASKDPADLPTAPEGGIEGLSNPSWTYRYAWKQASQTDPTKIEVIKTTPFNPFVWAEPLGQADRQGLSNNCPKEHPISSYRPVTRADGSVVNQAVCLKTATSTAAADVVIPTPLAGSGPVYAMECLHKNYAFNASDSLFSQTGPTLIANPGYNSTTKSYVMQPSHYKRILIDTEAKAIDRLSSDVWNLVYANKQAEVLSQAAQAKAQSSLAASEKKDPISYPYYSDCVGSLDEMAFSARNAMYVYAFNLLRIPSYEKSFVDITSYADITLRVMMSFFFLFMFFGVTIAMLVAMVARTFYIWFMMILSPIWVLTDVLKIWKGEEVDQEGVIGGFGKFLSLAMLPTILGLILSIGFIMFHFLTYMASLGGESAGRFNAGSISLWFNPGDAVGGLGDIFASMFGIFAIAALWVAVFAAFTMGFKNMRYVSKIIGGIKTGGQQVAGYMARTPLEAPIIPWGKDGKRVSLRSLKEGAAMKLNKLGQDRKDRNEEFLETLGVRESKKVSAAGRLDLNRRLNTRGAVDLDFINSKMKSAEFEGSKEGRQFSDELMKHLVDSRGNVQRTFSDRTITADGQNYTVTREVQQAMAAKLGGTVNEKARRDFASRAYHSTAVANDIASGNYRSGAYTDYSKTRNTLSDLFSTTPASGAAGAGAGVPGTVRIHPSDRTKLRLAQGSGTPVDIQIEPKANATETAEAFVGKQLPTYLTRAISEGKRIGGPKATLLTSILSHLTSIFGSSILETQRIGTSTQTIKQLVDRLYT